jgi:putative peptidoglycan lipid II flippase
VSAAVYGVLGAYALGITASSASRVLSSAFYALRETRTPARIAVLRVLLSAAVGVALMFPLDRIQLGTLRLGAVGLALGASVAAWLENFLLHRRLAALVGPHRPPAGRTARLALAALAAGAAAVLAKLLLGSAFPLRAGLVASAVGGDSPLLWPLVLLGTAVAFGVSYLAVASALRVGIPLSRLRRR